MNKIVKVVVEQAEGLAEDCKPFTYEGELCVEQAESKLREIALTAPAGGGYYKTDVQVTLVDGTDVSLRMDVQCLGTVDNDIEIMSHLRRFLEAYSGRVVPAQYRDKYTQEKWLQMICGRHGSEATMELARCLDVLNG